MLALSCARFAPAGVVVRQRCRRFGGHLSARQFATGLPEGTDPDGGSPEGGSLDGGSLEGERSVAARAASLIAVAEDLAGEFSLRPLLERILRRCTELLGCDAGSICSV